jgi:Beta-galactosidase
MKEQPPPIPIPTGVYSLGKPNVAASANVLSNPDVDGISIRVGWDNLVIADGVFDWAFLDSEIERAAAAGKKAIIRVNDCGTHIPSWVMDGVTTTYTFQTHLVWQDQGTFTIPVFWDAYYASKKQEMIAALGARYNSDPTVTAFVVGVANALGAEWNVPHRTIIDPPFTDSEVDRWLAAGYTTQELEDSANGFIDTAMAAFSNKAVAFAINPNGTLDANRITACSAVASASRAKWGNRLLVSDNGLAATTPTAPPPTANDEWNVWYNKGPYTCAQMLWFVYGDATYRMNGGMVGTDTTILTEAIDIGVSYRNRYQEIYETDVINLPDVITYAHSVIGQ